MDDPDNQGARVMRKRITPILLAMMIFLCLAAFILEAKTKILHRAIDDRVYDNRNHYLPCGKLPQEAEVRKVVEMHADAIPFAEPVNQEEVGIIEI